MAHKARKNLTCVDYAIRGESKRTTEITELLGVQPTCAFDEGDTYPSHELVDGVVRHVIRKRGSNVWHYSSEGLVQSDDINEHLAFVLAALEPAAGRIALLMQDQGLQPGVYLWNVDDLGFVADSPLLLTLAGITSWVAVSCWPEEDDGDEPDAGASAKTPSWLADYKPPPTYVEIGINDDTRSLAELSELLGVEPTSFFDRGDIATRHGGDDGNSVVRHSQSGWRYSSVGRVTGNEIDPHLEFLLAAIEPRAEQIAEILQNPEAVSYLWIYHAQEGRFQISSPLLARIARLTMHMNVWPEFDLPDDKRAPDIGEPA